MQALVLHPGMVLTDITHSLPKIIQTLQRIILSSVLLTPSQGVWVRGKGEAGSDW